MNSFWKKFLKSIGINILGAGVLCLPFVFISDQNQALGWLLIAFIIIAIALFIELITGLIFIVDTRQKELGQAILLTVGVILLIGFSVCSGAFR